MSYKKDPNAYETLDAVRAMLGFAPLDHDDKKTYSYERWGDELCAAAETAAGRNGRRVGPGAARFPWRDREER